MDKTKTTPNSLNVKHVPPKNRTSAVAPEIESVIVSENESVSSAENAVVSESENVKTVSARNSARSRVSVVAWQEENTTHSVNVKIRKAFKDVYKYLEGFGEATSMHGAKYVFWNATRAFRFFWLLSLASSVAFIGYLISVQMARFDKQVKIIVDDPQAHIKNIPFPSVTICANTRVEEKKLRWLSKINTIPSLTQKEVLFILEVLFIAMNRRNTDAIWEKLSSSTEDPAKFTNLLADFYDNSEGNLRRLVYHVLATIPQTFISCKWLGKIRNCSKIFRPTASDMGPCFTFGEKHHHEGRGMAPLPLDGENYHFVDASGTTTGLTLFLDTRQFPGVISRDFLGFVVRIHQPGSFSDAYKKGYIINRNTVSHIAITPQEITSDEDVMDTPISSRECIDDSESNLTILDDYSTANCMLECRYKRYLDACGCLPIVLKYLNYSEDPACSFLGLACLEDNEGMETSSGNFRINGTGRKTLPCDCPMSCESSVKYKTELSTSAFNPVLKDFRVLHPRLKHIHHVDFKDNMVVLNIYFKDFHYFRFKRSLMFTWEDIVGSIGGILGLGLGMSLVTMCEIVYFVLLKTFHGEIPS